MYHEFFGLSRAPFRITPDTDFFFAGANRGPILDALIYAISSGEGIVKVTGEVGTGKTMLCRMLEARLPENTETVYLVNPSVSPDEILHAIAFELQLPVEPGTPRLQVMHQLHDFLLARHRDGRRVVVFVEEAQSMPLATLEEIRLLSNLETEREKLLQIVLFGQPELDALLARPDIRQLRDRITHSFRLAPLQPAETAEYLAFRLRTAGYHGPDLFTPDLAGRIARAADGLTRRINVIADKALLAAFADNTHTVTAAHVRAAARDNAEEGARRGAWLRPALTAGGLVTAGIVAGVALHALMPAPAADGAASSGRIAPADAAPEAGAAGSDARGAATAAEAVARTTGQPVALAAGATAPQAGAEPVPAAPAAAPHGETGAVPAAPAEPAAAESPAPPPAPAAEPPLSAPLPRPRPDDPLEWRLTATREWLESAAEDTCTVQIAGVRFSENLRDWLNKLARSMPLEEIYVYATQARGQPLFTVLYGQYPDCRTAARIRPSLPPQLGARDPILRTAQGIRDELAGLSAAPGGG